MMLSLLKAKLRPLRKLYLKYFSEVGYFSRQLNRLESRITQFSMRAKRRRLAQRISASDAAYTGLLEQLKREGYAKTTLEALHIDAEILSYLKSLSSSYEAFSFENVKKDKAGKSKDYWIKMNNDWDADQAVCNSIVRNKFFLEFISQYFGEIPLFNNFEYMFSPSLPPGEPLRGSQNWHRDNHHPRVLKLFFSPFPLTQNEGVTQILPSYLSTGKYYTGYPDYMTDEKIVEAGINLGDQVLLKTQPGEIFLVDTARCLHCGSRNNAPRSLAIMTFTSTDRYIMRSSVNPDIAKRNEPLNQAMLELFE